MSELPTAAETAAPPTDPGPPPRRPNSGLDRFFSWLQDLGLARVDGWLGGVCAAIAVRLGIDPLIVRGVFVVAALFGLPVFVVYAVAWALLPDLTGRIHLQELTQRRFDPAMVGIGLMLLLGLLPTVPWFFASLNPGWPTSTPIGDLTSLLFLAIVGFVIYLATRRKQGATPAQTPVEVVEPAPFVEPPAAPSSEATDTDVAAWKEQHAAWKEQDAAWRNQQQDAERAAREQARAEKATASAAFAAEAAERRRMRRASKPRTSFGFVAFSLGAALVVGALAALGMSTGAEVVVSVAVGLLAGALVLAVSMIIAGAIRRRSGFLAFATILLLISGAATGAAAVTSGIRAGDTYVSNSDNSGSGEFTQLWGQLSISVGNYGDQATQDIDVIKRSGQTDIQIYEGVEVDLQINGLDRVQWQIIDSSEGEIVDYGTWKGRTGTGAEHVISENIRNPRNDDAALKQSITLAQQSGTVFVTIYQP